MTMQPAPEFSLIATKIVDAEKRRLLDSLSEDDFRDKVVRPVYRRLGMEHVRETCGPDEEGKDCIFAYRDPLGETVLIAVQTKRGKLTMAASSPSANLVMAEAQLNTALNALIIVNNHSEKRKPTQVHLCASGKISNQAREYLYQKFDSHRIKVLGSDEFIELVDKHYPEFWLGVDADRFPYTRALRQQLCDARDSIRIADVTGVNTDDSPILDANYLRLRITRMEYRVEKRSTTVIIGGKTVVQHQPRTEPRFIDIAVERLPDESSKLVLITADGGGGKTTALRRLAYQMVEKVLTGRPDTTLPVLLRATDLVGTGVKLVDILAKSTCPRQEDKIPFTADELADGKVAVLVDAMDEVRATDHDAVLEKIVAFHREYPKCLIVLTSREYKSILDLGQIGRFTHYRIMPVVLKDAEAVIDRAIEKRNVAKGIVQATLRKLNDTFGMSLSPMIITIFLSSSDFKTEDIPPNIAEIFKKFTEQMIGRWDESKGLHQQYEANTKDFLLRRIAFAMHVKRERSMPIADVRRIFGEELSKRDLSIESDAVFDEIVYRSGLLRNDGHSIEWRHHLLQEYFAGRGIPDLEFLKHHVHDEWWRSAIVFYFGDKPEAFSQLWEAVVHARELPPASRFDAAVTLGTATQACYLAETEQKAKSLRWVIETFASTLGAFRQQLEAGDLGAKSLMSLCTALMIARDAIATGTLARVSTDAGEVNGEAILAFDEADSERMMAWKIVGLLEAGSFAEASSYLARFNTSDRELIFILHLSVSWVLFIQPVSSVDRRKLQTYLDRTEEVIDDMRAALFTELKTVLFEIRSGKLTPVFPEPENHDVQLQGEQ